MLPFLKPKSIAGLIISKRKPDGGQTSPEPEDSPDQGLEACAEDLIRAFHAKDAKSVASALRAAFELMESEPHDEYGDDNSYDAQNAKAAKEQG